MKEIPDRKKEANSALRYVKTDFQSMMDEDRLNSFMTEDIFMTYLSCFVHQKLFKF